MLLLISTIVEYFVSNCIVNEPKSPQIFPIFKVILTNPWKRNSFLLVKLSHHLRVLHCLDFCLLMKNLFSSQKESKKVKKTTNVI